MAPSSQELEPPTNPGRFIDHESGGYGHGQRKRRKSFLEELFD
jgi:hypothetical protein